MSNVKVTVYDSNMDSNGPSTDIAYDYVVWLLNLLERIPLEWRAQVKIEHDAPYVSEVATLVYYLRPQTEAEIDAGIASELARKVQQRDRTETTIKRLQAEIDAEQARNEP